MSWFLYWFNFFFFNIPQWVYIQYITLYSNWIDWWKDTVKIKNLNTNSLPIKSNNNTDLIEDEGSKNKLFNKKNVIIGLGVIALIGVGILYYFYFSGNAGAGNNSGNNMNRRRK